MAALGAVLGRLVGALRVVSVTAAVVPVARAICLSPPLRFAVAAARSRRRRAVVVLGAAAGPADGAGSMGVWAVQGVLAT